VRPIQGYTSLEIATAGSVSVLITAVVIKSSSSQFETIECEAQPTSDERSLQSVMDRVVKVIR